MVTVLIQKLGNICLAVIASDRLTWAVGSWVPTIFCHFNFLNFWITIFYVERGSEIKSNILDDFFVKQLLSPDFK
jgi:hypothetical protein